MKKPFLAVIVSVGLLTGAGLLSADAKHPELRISLMPAYNLTGSDLAQGIFTLPVVLALRSDDGQLAEALSRRSKSRRAVSRATRIVLTGSGIVGARAAAEAYTKRAILAIEKLPPLPTRETLREVTGQLLSRTY